MVSAIYRTSRQGVNALRGLFVLFFTKSNSERKVSQSNGLRGTGSAPLPRSGCGADDGSKVLSDRVPSEAGKRRNSLIISMLRIKPDFRPLRKLLRFSNVAISIKGGVLTFVTSECSAQAVRLQTNQASLGPMDWGAEQPIEPSPTDRKRSSP